MSGPEGDPTMSSCVVVLVVVLAALGLVPGPVAAQHQGGQSRDRLAGAESGPGRERAGEGVSCVSAVSRS